METKHIDGKHKGNIMLYALSTCVWCKRTKRLINDLKIAYDYIDVDLLDRASERPVCEFRTWTVDEHVVVVGFGVDIEGEVDTAYCRAAGIPVVRRPSGGRSVMILSSTAAAPSLRKGSWPVTSS